MVWGPERRSVIFFANAPLVLKLDTLLKLSESTSYDLRAAYVLTYSAYTLKLTFTKGPTNNFRAVHKRSDP